MTTMTGKGFEVDSDSLHVKKFSRSSRRCDRISELPDEIITHILSFLSLKEAVATSILSTRWSNSWKYTPNLVFVNNSDCDPIINIPKAMPNGEPKKPSLEHSLMNVEWVNSVLNSYKALSLKQFTLSFYLHEKAFHHVTKWLHFAFSRRVESLKLDFESSSFALDLNVLSGVQSSNCRFLRVLKLQNLRVHGKAIDFLLNNCPVLEGLMIINATFWSNVVIRGSLKYLEISTRRNLGRFLKVCAPNLTRLLIFDYKLRKLLLGNVPNLVEASFPLYEDETMLHFPKAAAQLELLTISLHRPKAFTVPQMPNLKKLVVDYASVNKEYLLPIKNSNYSHTDYYSDSSIRKAIFEVPEDGGYRHKHLKVFEFVGFCDKAADQVKLVGYIGNNCVGLEEIAITPISTRVASEFQLRRDDWERMRSNILLRKVVEMIAEERKVLEIKKSMEDVLGKLSHGIKLRVN